MSREHTNVAKQTGPSLILHIGMPKTGSTALQGFLAHNRERLPDQQILYPQCGHPVRQHTALVKSIVVPLFDWALFNKSIDIFDPVVYINDVLKQCQEQQCQKVILSSEFFWASPAMQAGPAHHTPSPENFAYLNKFIRSCKDLFKDFSNCTIVVYLRRQDDWIDSFFNQQVKDGFSIPSRQELLGETKNYLLYHKNLALWADFFGKENIIVRYVDELPQRDVITDFVNLVGLDNNLLAQPEKNHRTANTKLSRKSASLMQKAVALQFDPAMLVLLREVLQNLSFQTSSKGKARGYTLFDSAFYKEVLELYCDDNSRLSEGYIDLTTPNTDRDALLTTTDNDQVNQGGDHFEAKFEELLEEFFVRFADHNIAVNNGQAGQNQEAALRAAQNQLAAAQQQLNDILTSKRWLLGNIVAAPYRKMKSLLSSSPF